MLSLEVWSVVLAKSSPWELKTVLSELSDEDWLPEQSRELLRSLIERGLDHFDRQWVDNTAYQHLDARLPPEVFCQLSRGCSWNVPQNRLYDTAQEAWLDLLEVLHRGVFLPNAFPCPNQSEQVRD